MLLALRPLAKTLNKRGCVGIIADELALLRAQLGR